MIIFIKHFFFSRKKLNRFHCMAGGVGPLKSVFLAIPDLLLALNPFFKFGNKKHFKNIIYYKFNFIDILLNII